MSLTGVVTNVIQITIERPARSTPCSEGWISYALPGLCCCRFAASGCRLALDLTWPSAGIAAHAEADTGVRPAFGAIRRSAGPNGGNGLGIDCRSTARLVDGCTASPQSASRVALDLDRTEPSRLSASALSIHIDEGGGFDRASTSLRLGRRGRLRSAGDNHWASSAVANSDFTRSRASASRIRTAPPSPGRTRSRSRAPCC